MRLTVSIALFLLSIGAFVAPARAQVITAGPDSVIVSVPDTATEDDNSFFLTKWDRPAKAALFSAIVPGLGQAYNKAYWKVPIVYATGGVLAYFWITNHNNYKDFEEALNIRINGGVDKYANSNNYGIDRPDKGIPYLKYARDYYRRNRDLTILLSIGAYGLQIAEAYVHAHMKEFDISDNLALRVQPDIMRVPTQLAYTPGLSLTLYTKSK
ncbi:hypothetical protein JAO76_09340 [Pontibacter sp. BT310]|uniref:DUF5683 domain-containing protein n=1 Tax=Pontibacter populi TaxID=890055 RepID=A0ABS6XB82_9BACT|nr:MULTISPECIES: DUF5683 domain-containing protein [Pontibacter]MBJ6118395.1 hypothetical protein [Pontibacter sp. BT310]MBR0570823.1 hypothetical protein [Microvirga sp. STS03]MBW3365249.1 hypothetical protein [Pontibacter populi]